ncbi:RNA-binding domain-containing protein [Rhizobium sp.]
MRNYVDALDLTQSVIERLMPGGRPYLAEKQLWDYKERLPYLPLERVTDEDRKAYNAEIGDIIKDVVSFHNAYGGYIVFGVADKGDDRIKGINGHFDCGDFNRRLNSYIGDNEVECIFSTFELTSGGTKKTLGVLLIPRRQSGKIPVRFSKDGPAKPNGSRSFGKETYVRMRDECRPAASTSTDWQFLHSDRAPPDTRVLQQRQNNIPSSLPARDPDLIEFLGRTEQLAKLREWLGDPRSPIRLITGIGGLGKTTLAYHFAEEVTELGAGGLEQVLWLTAKIKTFSVLKGELVPLGRVDFSDLNSLLREILRTIHYELLEEDDDDSDELQERVVEALSIIPSLVVVDDIDSLDPDEQKRVVSALNAIALRTVGRELSSSKILLTSRIDQGVPQTSVIKISGLERDVFGDYVGNIAKLFGIQKIEGGLLESLFISSSGSPLFSASIIRLVKLGENLATAVETWKGQDGEEVRAFAFEREINRLSSQEGRLLLAVLLLGATSINDLSEVLELTPKVVRERISQLQAYHLLAMSTKDDGQTKISVPDDLIAVTEILKSHLGADARSIEIACARAAEKSQTSMKSIGLAIRTITTLWKEGRGSEAEIVAKKLQAQHPKNADVSCIYGAALLKTSPVRAKEADVALENARRWGCHRTELPAYIVQAKTALEDWPGLYQATRSLSSNEVHRDVWLEAFITACRELIKIAQIRGDRKRVAELALGVVERVAQKLRRQQVSPSFLQQLVQYRTDFSREYFDAIAGLNLRPGDQLVLFEASIRLLDYDAVIVTLIRRALTALQVWWVDVERRPVIDMAARELLSKQMRRLDRLERRVRDVKGTDDPLVGEISKINHDLAFRGSRYGSS